jgi:hypothetical protein
MSSNARAAYGTLLKYGAGTSPETYTTLADVTNIGGPGLKMETLETTEHQSDSGFKEFAGGLIDGGEVKLELNFIPGATGLVQLQTDMYARTKRNFRVVWAGSPVVNWDFAALISGIEPAAPVDGKLAVSITLKVSGKPNLAGT